MRSYIIKRILLLFLTLWGISLISFSILQLAPGSPLEMKISRGQDGSLGERSTVTDEVMNRLKAQYHLDKPIIVRYGLWLSEIVRLDFGTSYSDNRPVIEKIKERLPVSLVFGFSGIAIALLIGLPLGILAAVKRGRPTDFLITFSSLAFYALPSYVLGVYLLTFFSGGEFFNWFPLSGIQSDQFEGMSFFSQVLDRLHHFVLPVICYTIGGLAYMIQQQRASLLESMNQDYVRTARAKGLSESKVVLKHALRNSLIPVLTVLGAMLPSILGASIIIENLFSIPGLGQLALDALLQRDYPTIMANLIIGALLSLLGLFLSDLLYAAVDPRITFD